MDDIFLRKASDEDAALLAELDGLCFTVPWNEESYRAEIPHELALYLIAEDENGKALGFAGCFGLPPEADITRVAVDPAFRRRGIARRLMEALFECGKERGIEEYMLEVRAGNWAAIALYEGLGFETVGKRSRYYSRPTEDALLMRRPAEEEE